MTDLNIEPTCDTCQSTDPTIYVVDGRHLCGECMDNLDSCPCARCDGRH